jgi:predicted phosphodiesterase
MTEALEDMISKKEHEKAINAAKREIESKYKDILSAPEYEIGKKLRDKGLNPKEVDVFLNSLKAGNPTPSKTYAVGKDHVRYAVISDTHIGNKHYDPALMDLCAKEIVKNKVDFVLHAGDIVDGWYQGRPESVFEQNAIGFDEQLDLAVQELSKIKKPLYFITGNHEYNTFTRNAGAEIGKVLETRLAAEGMEAHYLGNGEGDVLLKNGTKIRVTHPDGGTAYAISYKSQKLAESLDGGSKPNVLHIGHFHKAEYIFYRNIHIFQNGTFCGQTKFMRGKQISAHKGFFIVDLYGGKNGQVDKISPTFYPAYD